MSLFGENLVEEIKYAFQDAHVDIKHSVYDWYDDVIEHNGMFTECGTSTYIGSYYDTWELIVIGGTYYIEYPHAKGIVYFYSTKPDVKGFFDRDYIVIDKMGYVKAIDSIVSTIASIMFDDDSVRFWN